MAGANAKDRRSAGKRPPLDRDAWAEAAVVALSEGGLAAVAIEPIAARLGATKGSFYWHFANREELLAAAVALWEQRGTDQLIARLEAVDDPAERLRRLFEFVFHLPDDGRLDLALLAHADHPLIAPALERVTQRRIAYLEELFTAVGLPPADARHHAVLGYTAFAGLVQVQRASAGTVFPGDEAREAYLTFLFATAVKPGTAVSASGGTSAGRDPAGPAAPGAPAR